MKNHQNYFSLLGLALFVFVMLASCTKENDNNPAEEAEFNIEIVTNGTFGKILVNQKNQSIYFFASDVSGESNCNGGCADVWPAVTGDVYDLALDSELNRSDFNTITRADGQKQITYKGWPLYYFSPEGDGILENPGEVLGDGRGGVFHVAKPDYSILVGKQVVTEGEEAIVYLVNEQGVSLYKNNGDDENISNCSGGCANVWPPFNAAKLVIPSSLNISDFYTFDRGDDLGEQLSFKGSPLYFFSQDEQNRGSVLGQAGGPNQTFFIVEPDVQ